MIRSLVVLAMAASFAGAELTSLELNSSQSAEPFSCKAINFRMDYGGVGETGRYNVPAGANNELLELPCAFGKLDQGKVVFKCIGREWKFEKDNCHEAGQCPETNVDVTMFGLTDSFFLGRSNEGQELQRVCNFGEADYGELSFRCTDGQWQQLESLCVKPQRCAGVTVTHDVGRTPLPDGQEGDTLKQRCDTGGTMIFRCAGGSWFSDISACELPEGATCPERVLRYDLRAVGRLLLSAEEGAKHMEFRVPASAVGQVSMACGGVYNGWATFDCQADGSWSLVMKRPATTCWVGKGRPDWDSKYIACKQKNGANGDC